MSLAARGPLGQSVAYATVNRRWSEGGAKLAEQAGAHGGGGAVVGTLKLLPFSVGMGDAVELAIGGEVPEQCGLGAPGSGERVARR